MAAEGVDRDAQRYGDLDDLARRFRRFALLRAPSSSLYAHFALGIAEDPWVLRLAARATSSPVTNLLFAAVHYLLLSGVHHPLRAYYQSLTSDATAPEPSEVERSAFAAFRSFCLMYAEDVGHIISTRRTQTNEVRRCLYLASGCDLVGREAGGYSMIDVGSSAGLHLRWPHFGYDYAGHRLGDTASAVQLTCEFVGACRPALPDRWHTPISTTGIDLHPLNACNPDDALWLRALVWPEHAERRDLLERALTVARQYPASVVAGDAFTALPEIVEDTLPDVAVCVCHNMTLNQFSDADRTRFDKMLGELARQRPIYRLSGEWIGTEKPEFSLSRYYKGRKSQRLLARFDDHGGWVEWALG